MHPTLTIALRAAHAAAEKLIYTREHWGRLVEEAGTDASVDQFVTGASRRIHNTLRKSHPDQIFECTREGRYEPEKRQADVSWHAEVLLGENNFRHGLAECGVMVSQWQKGRIEHLTLVFPFLSLEVVASRGRGIQVSGRRVRTGKADRLSGVLLGSHPAVGDACFNLVTAGADLRVSGCALLDLTRVAAGQLDLAVHGRVAAGELAAAQLMATESGAVTGDLSGAPLDSRTQSVVCANPRLFKAAVSALRQT